ncbi:MAG: hypothetical protein ABI746_00310 [Dermatophilaceae bacterium]
MTSAMLLGGSASAWGAIPTESAVPPSTAPAASTTPGTSTPAAAAPSYRAVLIDPTAIIPAGQSIVDSSVGGASSTGLIVGNVTLQSGDTMITRGFVSSPDGPARWVDASPASGCRLTAAWDISSSGEVAGAATCPGVPAPSGVRIAPDGTTTILDTKPGYTTQVASINDRGTILGRINYSTQTQYVLDAVLWPAVGASRITDVSSVDQYMWGLSNTDMVVGSRAGVASYSVGTAELDRALSTPSAQANGGAISPNGKIAVGYTAVGAQRYIPGGPASSVSGAAGFQVTSVNDAGRAIGWVSTPTAEYDAVWQRGVSRPLLDVTQDLPAGWRTLAVELTNTGDIAVQAWDAQGKPHAMRLVALN